MMSRVFLLKCIQRALAEQSEAVGEHLELLRVIPGLEVYWKWCDWVGKRILAKYESEKHGQSAVSVLLLLLFCF